MKNLIAFLAALALALWVVPPALSPVPDRTPAPQPVCPAALSLPETPEPAPAALPISAAPPPALPEDKLPAAPEPEDLPEPAEASVPTPDEPCAPVTVRLLTGGRVVTLPLEDYVTGATAAEMPPWFPAEALKAQAIAVRTLALRNLSAGQKRHRNADLCTDPGCCMAYLPAEEAGETVRQAALDTEGQVILYEGEPILAAFCAAVRGHTRSSAEVWGGAVDYLVPVESPETVSPGGHGVGMSQYGAAALAERGLDAEAILKHYYTGVELGAAPAG